MAVQRGVHPSADVLQAFGLGKLDDSSSEVVMNHLEQCENCRKEVASLSGDDFVNRLRQARGHSSTSTPAKALSETAGGPKPSPSRPAIANIPPELEANHQYEFLRELGRGGMGVVYLAKNKLMDRLEVLKVVNKALLNHPGAVERFLREIRSAAKLSHANVVGAYSALQMGELLVFAMEYIEGQDLASVVKSQGPLPIPHACFYVQQAAQGLQHAFEKGMVHRDIKPQNLILAREGKKHIVKVLDFGLAKATREKKDDTGLTGEGQMLGTPDYIAPEQTLDAAKADIRADIYSLGCTLYYLLAGHPPFSARSLGAILVAHQMHEAKPLNLVRPEVPEELAAVVRKMMAKTPAKRYQTPREVLQALTPFVKQGATPKASPELSVGVAEAKPIVEKAASVAPAPVPAVEAPKKEPEPAAVWESLAEGDTASVGQRKSGVVRKPRAAIVRERNSRQQWLIGGGLGVGVLLLALLGMWAGGLIKVNTKDGTIVLENLPPDAEVLVDGETVTFKAADGKPITVTAGKKHQLQVKKEGFKVFGQEVEIDAGVRRLIRVSLQPEPVASKPSSQKSETANKSPQPSSPPTTADNGKAEEGFTSLSGGKNWDKWYIQRRINGVGDWDFGSLELHGSYRQRWAGDEPIVATKRDDFRDFHLRFQVRLGASEAIFCFRDQPPFLRHPDSPYPVDKRKGYGVLLADVQRARDDWNPYASGSLFVSGQNNHTEPLASASEDKWIKGEWNTIEVIARANSITVAINGTKVVEYVDEEVRFRRGHFSFNPARGCELFVRNVRIRELPATDFKPIARPSLLASDKAFVALFNGKDLTGWKVYPQGTGSWKVEAGLLTGRGPQSHLFSQRGDYENFHLRVEARINRRGDSGLLFRSVFDSGFPAACEAQIYVDRPEKDIGTGALFAFGKGGEETLRIDPSELHLMDADQWFTLEVIAEGNHIVILVNGKKTVDHKLTADYRRKGHLALQQFGPGTVVEFRKVEIKELPATKSEALPAAKATAEKNGFVPLFNGKDLTGWKVFGGGTGSWKVVDGAIVSSGQISHLFSERGDYENFHYRVVAMINDGGNSGQYFRARFGPRIPAGYEAEINSTGIDPHRTGSLYGIVNISEIHHKPDEWFTQEVIAQGNHIVIKVNGRTVVDTHDSRYKRGHFALQQHNSATVVKFCKIEVKELPPGPAPGSVASSLPAEAKEAAKAYKTACAEARTKLLADFDTAVERLAKMEGDTEPRLKLIEAVKSEKKRFDNKGLLPWSEPMRPFLAKYFSSLGAAEEKLRRVYGSLASAQLKAKKESKVAELQADLENLIGVRLLARWRHFLNGRPQGINCLYSDGKIHAIINGNAIKGTWTFAKGVFIYRWPDPKAPGGAWIDTLNVSADGMRYEGSNQQKKIKLLGEYMK